MNNKLWPTLLVLIIAALMTLASSIFFYVVNSHEKRLAALENVLMGERGTESRGSERE